MLRTECKMLELKTTSDTMTFEGYGAVFNNVDAYADVIAPGAFTKYLEKVHGGSEQWPLLMSQHGGWSMSAEDMTPIGVWADISEDTKGLKVTGKLADTERGREAYALIKMEPRPAFSGLSIGYFAIETVNGKKTDPYARLIKQIDLVEISLVSRPANHLARISGVKLLEDLNEKEFEQLLREAGFSRNEAKMINSKGFKAFKNQREADNEGLDDVIADIKGNSQLLSNYHRSHHG